MELEEAFGTDIPDEAATGMLTVQDAIDYIAEHVSIVPDGNGIVGKKVNHYDASP